MQSLMTVLVKSMSNAAFLILLFFNKKKSEVFVINTALIELVNDKT